MTSKLSAPPPRQPPPPAPPHFPPHLLRLRRPPPPLAAPPTTSSGRARRHHLLCRLPPSSFSRTISGHGGPRDPAALGPRRGLSHRIRPPRPLVRQQTTDPAATDPSTWKPSARAAWRLIRRGPHRCLYTAPPRPGLSSPSPAGRPRRATPPLATERRPARRQALAAPCCPRQIRRANPHPHLPRGGSDKLYHHALAGGPPSLLHSRRRAQAAAPSFLPAILPQATSGWIWSARRRIWPRLQPPRRDGV
uniref:Uncharacterized protein n=1 Tax=Triticum urartu TaxID=4572 RepID=A0A8R7UEN4_TRIUA